MISDSKYKDPPLIYLFEDDHLVSDSAALIYNLYKNEKILWVPVGLRNPVSTSRPKKFC